MLESVVPHRYSTVHLHELPKRYREYLVQFDGDGGSSYVRRTHLWAVCKNCEMPRKAHAAKGKCLFEPATYWET